MKKMSKRRSRRRHPQSYIKYRSADPISAKVADINLAEVEWNDENKELLALTSPVMQQNGEYVLQMYRPLQLLKKSVTRFYPHNEENMFPPPKDLPGFVDQLINLAATDNLLDIYRQSESITAQLRFAQPKLTRSLLEQLRHGIQAIDEIHQHYIHTQETETRSSLAEIQWSEETLRKDMGVPHLTTRKTTPYEQVQVFKSSSSIINFVSSVELLDRIPSNNRLQSFDINMNKELADTAKQNLNSKMVYVLGNRLYYGFMFGCKVAIERLMESIPSSGQGGSSSNSKQETS